MSVYWHSKRRLPTARTFAAPRALLPEIRPIRLARIEVTPRIGQAECSLSDCQFQRHTLWRAEHDGATVGKLSGQAVGLCPGELRQALSEGLVEGDRRSNPLARQRAVDRFAVVSDEVGQLRIILNEQDIAARIDQQ